MKYVDLIVDLPVENVDKSFTYHVPEELKSEVELGKKVVVSFRRQKIEGYVIEEREEVDFDTKPIIDLASPYVFFDQELLELAKWMARYYQCYLISAIKAIVPSGKNQVKTKRVVNLNQSAAETKKTVSRLESKAPKQTEVLNYLLANPEEKLTTTELAERANTSPGTIRRLKEKDLVSYSREEVKRIPYGEHNFSATAPFELTADQTAVFAQLKAALTEEEAETILLKGVTGSGKTEIYLQAIRKVIAGGGAAIVLIPEISLTPQTINRFKSRFGDQVAVLHSQLSAGERFDEWRRIKEGAAQIVVGARSAIFAPVKNLELIVIDEEHETTYKQENHPKYHAREAAIKRANAHQAVTLLGTATPSLESYYRTQQGDYKLLTLPDRIDDRPLPEVEIIDMREELKAGNRTMVSRQLKTELEKRLEAGEQSIIFLNRRGFSTFVQCRECGYVMECEHCDISLTYHEREQILKCHYCNYTTKVPDVCPDCGSKYIKHFGIGTQQVEEVLSEIFPTAEVVRMDRDTTTRKGSYRKILSRFKQGEIDILVGTQMVAKGHDYPNVTLVGVITADTALNLPDFRASERTFQLLAQVAGRTGRGDKGGEVVIQTYTPQHYSIQYAKEHDYQGFYNHEIVFREKSGYPPVGHLINLIVSDPEEEKTIQVAQKLGTIISSKLDTLTNKEVELMGPVPASLAKLQGEYRWQLLLKGRDLSQLREVMQEARKELEAANNFKSVKIDIDVDPLRVL